MARNDRVAALLYLASAGMTSSLLSAGNTLEVEKASGTPGGTVRAQVLLTHEKAIDGFQVTLLYDGSFLVLKSVDAGRDLEVLRPEAFILDVEPEFEPGMTRLTAGVLFDFVPPFDGRGLGPGRRQSLLAFHFEIVDDPGLIGHCTPLKLGETSLAETLIEGQICVVEHPVYQRGDCNGDGRVTGQVSDAVFLLSYNFGGGPEPPCLAACDANADGEVGGQVTDAVYLLSFSFLGGPPPPPPFPDCAAGESSADKALGCDRPAEKCR